MNEMPEPSALTAEIARLCTAVDTSFEALIGGADLDLSGLDEEIGLLCQAAAAITPEQRAGVAQNMTLLFAKVDRLGEELLRRQALTSREGEAERSQRVRSAVTAYQRRAEDW